MTFPNCDIKRCYYCALHSYLSNSQGGGNKRGGGAKVAKSKNMGDGIFWEKSKKINKHEGLKCKLRVDFFSDSISVTSLLEK